MATGHKRLDYWTKHQVRAFQIKQSFKCYLHPHQLEIGYWIICNPHQCNTDYNSVNQGEHQTSVPAIYMCGAHLQHCEVHSCLVTLHGAYLAVLQPVPPSLWIGPCWQWELYFVSWRMTVLRGGLKRVKPHIQRRSKPTFDPRQFNTTPY